MHCCFYEKVECVGRECHLSTPIYLLSTPCSYDYLLAWHRHIMYTYNPFLLLPCQFVVTTPQRFQDSNLYMYKHMARLSRIEQIHKDLRKFQFTALSTNFHNLSGNYVMEIFMRFYIVTGLVWKTLGFINLQNVTVFRETRKNHRTLYL